MKIRKRNLVFFLFVAVFFIVMPVLFLSSSFVSISSGLIWCSTTGYHQDRFLAGCERGRFGEYDRLAFMFETEPRLENALKNAQVLFLGNSHLQYAFSNYTVDTFFYERQMRHFLMGFSGDEYDSFPAEMIRQRSLKPKVVVINVDPFFKGQFSSYTASLMRNPKQARSEAAFRKRLIDYHSEMCQKSPTRFSCRGVSGAFYRAYQNGEWVNQGKTDYRIYPLQYEHSFDNADATKAGVVLDRTDVLELDADMWSVDENIPDMPPKRAIVSDLTYKSYLDNAKQFFEDSGVSPSKCVVFTIVPAPHVSPGFVRKLADDLGVSAIIHLPDGLRTFDRVHIRRDSAVIWAEEFLEQLDPIVKNCVTRS